MKQYRICVSIAAFSAIFLPVIALAAPEVFTVPPNDGFVTDGAGILTPADETTLESLLSEYQRATSNEIAVLIVPTLFHQPIEDAAIEVGRKWGIGSVKNNGILLFIAHEDRTLRLEVGYGLEGSVPDIVAKGIIEKDIAPHFRDGRYGDGIRAGIDSLMKHIGGEYTAERYTEDSGSSIPSGLIFFAFIVFEWLLAVMGRTKSWWLGGVFGAISGIALTAFLGYWLTIPILTLIGLLLDYVVSKNYHRRGRTSFWAGGGWGPGGMGGGSGGGGFGGFGGGSFGGGGSSGRW